jgi:transcriptional regulator with XRE-family HTH domain
MKAAVMKPQGSKIAREAALAQIKTAMIEKKLTQAELADAADCHEKTIQNLMGGRSVRDQTLFDVCMVLGLDFEKLKAVWNGGGAPEPMELTGEGGLVAPVYMGAYTRAAVDHYIGSYLTLRPSFAHADTIVAYRTDVTWDPEWPSLLFQEHDRPDAPYSHRGRIYVPPASMFIHLVSLTKGAMRMVVVSQIDRFSEMRGIITTLHKHGAMLMPVATPIVYAKRDDFSGALGDIGRENPSYARYKKVLEETTAQGYARLVGS